jgi:hypothetical protein
MCKLNQSTVKTTAVDLFFVEFFYNFCVIVDAFLSFLAKKAPLFVLGHLSDASLNEKRRLLKL